MVQTYSCSTHHEDVIGVWNLASSSEEFTKVVELERKLKERENENQHFQRREGEPSRADLPDRGCLRRQSPEWTLAEHLTLPAANRRHNHTISAQPTEERSTHTLNTRT